MTQLIDSATQVDLTQPIVSNSLPIWLSLSALVPVYRVKVPWGPPFKAEWGARLVAGVADWPEVW